MPGALRGLRRSRAPGHRSASRYRARNGRVLPPPRGDELVRALPGSRAMKIAFALIPEKGHINPYIGPAQALADSGHEVAIGAPGDIACQIAAAGLTFRADLIGH